MISCGSEQEKLTVYIPDTCTDTLQYEIYLPEEEGLNIFYDLCVTDSFCAFLDTRNDTLLKIFTATIPPALVGLGMKGEGPDDFLFPFFEKSIGREGKGELSFIELNSWNKKTVAIHSAASPAPVAVSVVEAQQLPEMPVVRDYNETDSCVYGIDVDRYVGENCRSPYNKSGLQSATHDERIRNYVTSRSKVCKKSCGIYSKYTVYSIYEFVRNIIKKRRNSVA